MTEEKRLGLTAREVKRSRQEHGENRLTRKPRTGFFKQFLANFGDPIIKVLLVALAINVIFLFRNHDWFESIGIAVAVFLATFVSTLSEYGSESAFEKLQAESACIRCRVRRDGKTVLLPAEELVVGDLVLLQSGEQVPADGILLDGELYLDQSALNGESREVLKHPGGEWAELTDMHDTHVLLCGSVVCKGNGCMQVRRIGDQTFYGQLAGEIQDKTRESPLKLRLAGLAGTLSKLGFFAAGCVAFSDLFHLLVMENQYSLPAIMNTLSQPSELIGALLHAATLAITVVVVAVPEGLPMMITVVLSSNMRRMLRDHVLVRKLVGIETSGSLNILFTDKTGTLTKGRPEMSLFTDACGNEYSINALRREKELWEFVRLSGYYNTESQLSGGEILGGNATDRALMDCVRDRHPLNTTCTRLKQIPFDSNRKWSAVYIGGPLPSFWSFPCMTLVKGAPEKILSACTGYWDPVKGICPLNTTEKAAAAERHMESAAMRTVALAVSDKEPGDSLSGLILIGIFGLRDELRSDVHEAVKTVRNAGIQVVMITGDSRETAAAIATSAGLLTDSRKDILLTSREMATLDDESLKSMLPRLRVVARALPSDKSRLVRLSQESGLVVGMTGDGVNDAPALKKADIGFAMGSGTEVAKQAGDIIILNDRFSSIAKAILYGRTIFKSIRKFIIFQLTMNLCAVGVSVIGPFIGVETPVTVMQMLWINIIMDTLAGLAFAGEPPLKEYMNETPKRRDEPVINRYMLNQILCTGIYTIALCILYLKWDPLKLLFRYYENPLYWLTGFFALFIFSGIFNCFNARTNRLHLLSHLRQNPAFVCIIALVAVVQIALIYYGGVLFRTAALLPKELLYVLLLSATVVPFDWLRKIILRLNHRKGTL